MTVIETLEPTAFDSPAIARALRHIGNPDPARLHCPCGCCLADDDYSFPELSLDACMTDVLRMVDIVESCTPEPHPGARVALHIMRELVANARLLLCVQRQTMRAEVLFRPTGNNAGST